MPGQEKHWLNVSSKDILCKLAAVMCVFVSIVIPPAAKVAAGGKILKLNRKGLILSEKRGGHFSGCRV